MAKAGRGTGKGTKSTKGARARRPSKADAGKRPAARRKAGPQPRPQAREEARTGPRPQAREGGSGAAPDPAAGAGHGRSALDSLGDLADRAAQRFANFVDRARNRAAPAAEKAAEATRRMAVDLEGGWEEAFHKIREQAKDLMAKGKHTRVRIKFRDKQIAELPIAAVAAAEVASYAAFGPFRLVIGHLIGKAVLDVEFVSNADAHVAEGRALLADGEMEQALAAFDKAVAIDRRCAGAHLGRGIALKLRGEKAAARAAFEKAEECDPHGEAGREARRHLDNLPA